MGFWEVQSCASLCEDEQSKCYRQELGDACDCDI